MIRPAFALATLLVACSSSSSSSSSDAGAADGAVTHDSAPGTIRELGRVVDYGTKKPIQGATITVAGQTTTSAADGTWSFQVPLGTATRPTVTMNGYINVHLPEEISEADNDRHDLPLPDLQTFQLGQYAQRGYDLTKASISIAVYALPPCAGTEGTTLKVVSPPGASVEYFQASFPSAAVTATVAGEIPAVSVYNLDPGAEFVFELTHPTCKQVPWPVKVGSLTFTGKVTTEAGNANSVLIMYMQ